ncbi:hypothetical protein EB796_017770 [Bugula neritina]|uniref:SIDT2 n=1 Tax=Bugula neritina TaxID=10212 RepID=A0A7J7JE75_BUGNE|nr:hypothetical protein EB796_017770 [Bugula neritina]
MFIYGGNFLYSSYLYFAFGRNSVSFKTTPGFPNIVEAVFGETYEENSTRNHGFLFEYSYNHTYNSAVYITTGLINKEKNYSNDFPTQVVVRQELAIQSWDLPLLMQSGVEFSQVSRKLCATGQNINTTLPISIEVTTFSERLIEFSIHAEIQVNLTVSIGTDYTIFVTPTSPQYYQFTFPKNSTQAVTLYVNSSQNYYCSRVAIQSAERVSKAVYIVFTVMPNDQLCSSQERTIPIGDPKVKEMEFWIEDHIEETVYIFALLAAVGYCSAYCLAAVLYLLIIKLWERRRKSQEIEMNSPVPTISNGNTEASASADNPSINDINHDDSLLLDADTLADQDEIKDVYRLKKNLMVADMARKPSTHLRKKYMLYVRFRDSMSKPEEERERLGIPQHVGIFYAMGLALFVEGIMSGCYHVCPSYNNFQFDTAFMYILGGLLTLRLFQSRHPDINANAHTAFISLAIIIIIAVVGVLFNSSVFWYVFTFFYLLSVIYLSIKIYYVGRFKFAERDRGLALEQDLDLSCLVGFLVSLT